MSGNMSRSWRLYVCHDGYIVDHGGYILNHCGYILDAREAYAPKMSKIQVVRWEDGQAAT